jgi:hypothetical protein
MFTCFQSRIVSVLSELFLSDNLFKKKENCVQALTSADPQTKEYCQMSIGSAVSELRVDRKGPYLICER